MTAILGIVVPSTSPAFLAGIALHVLAGLTAVVAGIGAMIARKGRGRHPRFGKTYYWALAVVFASATALAIARWAQDWHLFVLGALAFAAATFGRQAMRTRRTAWARLHIAGMGSSYILLITAFYVDNGKSLPLWRDLPLPAYWIVPATIGIPIVVLAIARHAHALEQARLQQSV